MAMLITRFHKVIQSKVVWYFILGVIVISFVGFFTPSMKASGRTKKVRPAGELFGKKIPMEEFARARHNAYCSRILASGQMLDMSDELDAVLHQEAWRRVAVLRKAREQKISVTEEEGVDQIHMYPLFRGQNGAFDINIYKAVLNALNLSSQQLEALFREQVLIGKVTSMSAQAALVSPSELDELYHRYADRVVLDYVFIPSAQTEKDVTVSVEEAQALYAESPEKFRKEARMQVSYVEFPVSNYLAQVEIPADAALQFYNQNIQQFRVEATNENGIADFKKFEEVEGEITEELRKASARKLAIEKATEFVADVAPKAEGAQPDFTGVAAASGLEVKTLPAFGMSDTLQGIDETSPFKAAAFGLEDDAFISFSDAVVGRNFVYVLSFVQRYPSFIPEFEVVKDKVMKEARRQAAVKALAERAREIETAVVTAGANSIGFKEAVAPFELTVQSTEEFDVMTEVTNAYTKALMRGCTDVKQGGLCDLTPVEGGVLLASVASRIPAVEGPESAGLRQELSEYLSRSSAQRLSLEWQDSLLVEGGLKDFTKEPVK